MSKSGISIALVVLLWSAGADAQIISSAPTMPPDEVGSITECPDRQYAHAYRWEWWGGEQGWKWNDGYCKDKPAKWRPGCSWQMARWVADGQGGSRIVFGYLQCPKKIIGRKEDKPAPVATKPRRGGGAAADDLGALKSLSGETLKPDFAKATPPKKAPILAVFDIEVVGLKLKQTFTKSLADFVAMRLTETKAYQVVPRSQLKERLVESKVESFKDCYDQACQIEIGKELAAEKTLATRISKMGSNCTVSLGVFDLKKATAERAATHYGKCTEDGLFDSVKKAIAKLAKG